MKHSNSKILIILLSLIVVYSNASTAQLPKKGYIRCDTIHSLQAEQVGSAIILWNEDVVCYQYHKPSNIFFHTLCVSSKHITRDGYYNILHWHKCTVIWKKYREKWFKYVTIIHTSKRVKTKYGKHYLWQAGNTNHNSMDTQWEKL